ncbi:lipopolysaccharide assembly protein LapA domain-containing protein [Cellulomonas sp. RIT-PI-Y]|uniref:LapA family protein n=1 Tax=Cellulomonas sp. RIT-PI-Y TaxID=3035297 RepID=UPI0021DA2959|nr:lipopolysaccharide assembly protein LapA domain-containing protein [Cellulomonas sp. RIT-PI-Y]
MPVPSRTTRQPGQTGYDPADPIAEVASPGGSAGTGRQDRLDRPARTRTGSAWVGICVGALVLVALVVFMLQNTEPVDVTFLGMTGTAPLALVLLVAGLGVGVVALVVGALRIGQLRRRLRAGRRPTAAPSRSTL